MMFCWGNATHHELCLNGPGTAADLVIKPTLSKWKESNHLQLVAAGEFHTLYLTNHGHLYSCGSNDVGQLGRQTESSDGESPDLVETFKGCAISTVACGIQHSMALDEWGQPFSWGSDSMGQLGSNLGAHAQDKPKIIKFLATRNVIQIACGSYHSIALTNNGDLYSWGANSFGQCGLGNMTNKETTPQQITSLLGVPISLVACGSNHTFVLSKRDREGTRQSSIICTMIFGGKVITKLHLFDINVFFQYTPKRTELLNKECKKDSDQKNGNGVMPSPPLTMIKHIKV